MATITATSFNTKTVTNAPPGLNAIYATINLTTTTLSVGDTLLLAKIPPKCKIIDIIEDHTIGTTATSFDIGFPAADLGSNSAWGASAVATALAKGSVNRANATKRLPVQVNCTASNRDYSILQAKCTGGTGSVSLIMRCTVIFEPNNDQSIG